MSQWPEFNPKNPQKGGRREKTPQSYFLTSTCTPWANKIIIQILKLMNTTWQCLPYDNRKSRIWVSWQIYFTYTYQLIHFHQSKIVHDSPKENNRKKTEISNHGWMYKWTLTDHTVENYYTLWRDEILINTIIWMNCENIHVSNRIFTQEWCTVVTQKFYTYETNL